MLLHSVDGMFSTNQLKYSMNSKEPGKPGVLKAQDTFPL